MTISDGTILRVVATLLFPDNVIAQNIFYAVFTDSGTSNEAEDVITDMETWIESMYTALRDQIGTGVSMTVSKVYEYDPIDDDWDEVGDFVPTVAMQASGGMLPHGVAAIVHGKTIDPDVHATKYFGGFGELAQADSILNAGALEDLADAADLWCENFVGSETGADYGVGVWSPTRTTFKLFSGTYVVNTVLGYQRRRKPGVGI